MRPNEVITALTTSNPATARSMARVCTLLASMPQLCRRIPSWAMLPQARRRGKRKESCFAHQVCAASKRSIFQHRLCLSRACGAEGNHERPSRKKSEQAVASWFSYAPAAVTHLQTCCMQALPLSKQLQLT